MDCPREKSLNTLAGLIVIAFDFVNLSALVTLLPTLTLKLIIGLFI